MTTFDNSVALITGGSRGIGRAIAERLARDGVAVALVYEKNREAASAVVEAITARGGRAVALQGNVTRAVDVTRLFVETEKQFGVPNVVVAVAGSFLAKPFAEMTEDDFDEGLRVNAKGTFLIFSEAARRVPEGGRIIGCSSSLVVQGRPGLALYTAGKAAVEQFVKILAKELGPRQITVNAIAPGPTDTELLSERGRSTAPQMTPLGRIGRPEEIAELVAFLASREGGWVNGQVIGVNGGIV